jgi:hypothetical protein
MTTLTSKGTVISVDLGEAARRSDSFPVGWSDEKLQAAIGRYERFLRLAAKHPDAPLAPTREIDEIWHLHMLQPVAYARDCHRLMGHLLDHDGGFGKAPEELPVLRATFESTAKLWREEYGESYEPELAADGVTKCWHDCQSRCWHACKSDAYGPAGEGWHACLAVG